MGDVLQLVLRALAGAIVGTAVGLGADLLVRTQGYWVVGLMAGLIGGVLTVYLGTQSAAPEQEKQG